MLSWSSTEAGTPADLAAIAEGTGDGGLPYGAELVAFADAAGGFDDEALAMARERLRQAAGAAFTLDAAAVLANFEMMTRVADGTGARFPAEEASHRAALDARLDIDGFTSTR
ncbi:MAG TPA: hypothetical protein PK020_13860 [Ilumatobacteraceae bacterium]|nr:hypothetical protein [Ilumatobacteraceae bacterium]HRB04323.1 hypothetical protein [Ilumatobacteraceae bacterium]